MSSTGPHWIINGVGLSFCMHHRPSGILLLLPLPGDLTGCRHDDPTGP
jgi:hypothetical protein